MSAKDIILKLNELGGANGIGILDIVENRLVGMKCRGVYETPGGTILYKAHSVLETLCLDKMTMHEKQKLAVTFGELVYNGQWFTPLREALSAFVTKTQEHVTGTVRLKLYKGNIINAGVWSPYSLYSEEIATFGASDYNQADAAGFIQLYGRRSPCRRRLTARACKRYNKYIVRFSPRAGPPGAGRSFQTPRKCARMARALQRAASFSNESPAKRVSFEITHEGRPSPWQKCGRAARPA